MTAPDYNLLTPAVLDSLLKRPIEKALGEREIKRINDIYANYDYYNGKQDVNEFGQYIYPTESTDRKGRDFEPTRYWTNYFKAFIKRKSRWQMAGQHSIDVKPTKDDRASNEKSQKVEDLLTKLWHDNQMDAKKMQIARDRLIAGSVAVKLSFNPRTGKLHWIWHNASEVFPIYSKDGFHDLIGCDIIIAQESREEVDRLEYVRQSFRLDESRNECWVDERVFDETLQEIEVIQDKTYLGFDFIPMVMFDVETVNSNTTNFDDLEDMKVLTRILNDMMEDANDSLKFEMFSMTVIKNAKLDNPDDIVVAPGSLLKVDSAQGGHPADVESVQNGFKWKEAYKDQYNRIKSALHELSGLPMIVPQELNFGGMNDRALQVLYQDIIQETQEHWLKYNEDFKELFEKSLMYLQARKDSKKFSYDKSTVSSVELSELDISMNFILPLPDDRENLVDLLTKEVDTGFESRKNAMKRLGVKNPGEKENEIFEELMQQRNMDDPLGDGLRNLRNSATSPIEEELTEDNTIPQEQEELMDEE
ncbi:phage portal protein [Abyssicoccus albus]|uniref:SPP1 Gp6-like portal protein n=1 Tax=Abyssicoccus albus TaxID=1817405 RepID=A0A3N5C5Q0_9BACL|nr:phage portal protein [Abyssicoccus albus]RPF54742.1 SPP1 Gp6-like portal protein [Abyssicoccus albus]